nr:hypothetical protein [Butyricicoccus sp. OF10-2]
MEELTQYIKADFAVLVAVLYCIGRGLKAIQRFPNQFILWHSRSAGLDWPVCRSYRAMPATATGQPLCLKVLCRVSYVRACRSI